MLSQWIKCLDKRPEDRSDEDLEVIYKKLKTIKLFRRIHPSIVQQLCFVSYAEHLDKGVVLYKEGDEALNWYAVIYGSLDVQVSHTGAKRKDVETVCTLGVGTAFGESVLGDGCHSHSIITQEPCTLLRVRRTDFQDLWSHKSHLMQEIVANCYDTKAKLHGNGGGTTCAGSSGGGSGSDGGGGGGGGGGQLATDTRLRQSSIDSLSHISNNHNIRTNGNGINQLVDSYTTCLSSLINTEIPENEPMSPLFRIGWTIRSVILNTAQLMIRDRKYHIPSLSSSPSSSSTTLYHRCLIGSELIDWILTITANTQVRVHSRGQAAAMCHVLLEAQVLNKVTTNDMTVDNTDTNTTDPTDQQFMDRYILYRFCFDDPLDDPIVCGNGDKLVVDSELIQSLQALAVLAPDAMFRLILRKPPTKRTDEEIESVYEELMHIKALSHLSNSVRKELSAVIAFESHPKKATILFNQGDCGHCWYIILSGSVNVVIAGKGIVCTLHEGDDFGKLALVNEAPRAATIVTNEANCQLLRVDKSHFDRILRDVEANTVRLKEHGREVLILQRMAADGSHRMQCNTFAFESGSHQSHYKYMVMAGTPEKMLEHLLETRLDSIHNLLSMDNHHQHQQQQNGSSTGSTNGGGIGSSSSSIASGGNGTIDTLLLDFILTFPVFISWKHLCNQLMRYYRIDELNQRQEREFIVANKRRVVRFMHYWFLIAGEAFLRNKIVWPFIDDLVEALQKDILKYKTFDNELLTLKTITEAKSIYDLEMDIRGVQKWKADNPGSVRRMSTVPELNATNDNKNKWLSIKENDEIICRVFCADHTYTTLKINVDTKVDQIKCQAADKLGMDKVNELVLVELKSNAERLPFRDTEISIPTALTVNGRIFIAHVDHLDALTTIGEQDGPAKGTAHQLEMFSTQEFAYQLTQYGWQLFRNLNDYELIYHVFGRHNFQEITANLDIFLRHFNEIQYWTVTELVIEKSLSRRVQLLRKLIKIAGYCKDYQNLNAFFAIIMGLSNVSVSRLSQTWERLPNKIKRQFSQYESLIDPSRNHRRYRIMVAKMTPPLIPFMPLMLKDITFAHEGNKTYIEQGLVNFEKMHMIAQTLRTIRDCKSGVVSLEQPPQQQSSMSLKKTLQTTTGSATSTTTTSQQSIQQYIQDIKVIDNMRRLTQLSHSIEHRKL